MELVLAIVAGSLYACGLYLMLRRRLAQLIIGLSLLANGSNILIFAAAGVTRGQPPIVADRSEEHTSELQSQSNLVCRLLLEKKKNKQNTTHTNQYPLSN